MPNLDLFVAPGTGEKLVLTENDTLVNDSGTIEFPVVNGIPRFVSKEMFDESIQRIGEDGLQTANSFGKKWRESSFEMMGTQNEFEKANLKEQFLAMLGCESEKELKKLFSLAKRTLNGGCGVAWSEYLFDVNPKTERHCVDLSLAVETAYKHTITMPNVTVSQASILELPYPEDFFDIVYSDGVVHHTPDPKKATKELGRRVAPGGLLGIYIYTDLVTHKMSRKAEVHLIGRCTIRHQNWTF